MRGVAGPVWTALGIVGLLQTGCGGKSGPIESESSLQADAGSPEASPTGGLHGGAEAGTDAPVAASDDATAAADGAALEPDATATAAALGSTSQPSVGGDGYLTLDAGPYVLVGYVSSTVGGSSSSISLTYGSTSFCASGIVGANGTYNSWAEAGFNVDQTQGQPGAQATANSLLLSASSITVAFSNQGGSPLMIQLVDQGFHYWCYSLAAATSPVTIPLSSFNSACWDDSGQTFAPGTAILAIDLEVPGSNTASTPYSFCFLGMTIAAIADAGP